MSDFRPGTVLDERFEIEAEVSHYDEFHILIDKFRATFDSKIKSVEHLLLRKDYFHRISRSAL